MLATALSASIVGVDGVPVRVEVDVAFGLPGLTIVGLGGSAVLEARERVRAALRNPDSRFHRDASPSILLPRAPSSSRSLLEGRVLVNRSCAPTLHADHGDLRSIRGRLALPRHSSRRVSGC